MATPNGLLAAGLGLFTVTGTLKALDARLPAVGASPPAWVLIGVAAVRRVRPARRRDARALVGADTTGRPAGRTGAVAIG